MKQITIIRHAKAAPGDDTLSDSERPLTAEGEKTALRTGQLLRHKGLKPDLILSSPALRARATAELLAAGLQLPILETRTDECLYRQDVSTILQLLREIDDRFTHVWLVGHNPTALDLINLLADAPTDSLPPSGAVQLELPIERWRDAAPLCGRVVARFLTP
ncbi:MAG: SixA phosphatase family protein [Kiritimatiellia bacterium]